MKAKLFTGCPYHSQSFITRLVRMAGYLLPKISQILALTQLRCIDYLRLELLESIRKRSRKRFPLHELLKNKFQPESSNPEMHGADLETVRRRASCQKDIHTSPEHLELVLHNVFLRKHPSLPENTENAWACRIKAKQRDYTQSPNVWCSTGPPKKHLLGRRWPIKPSLGKHQLNWSNDQNTKAVLSTSFLHLLYIFVRSL